MVTDDNRVDTWYKMCQYPIDKVRCFVHKTPNLEHKPDFLFVCFSRFPSNMIQNKSRNLQVRMILSLADQLKAGDWSVGHAFRL